MDVVIKRLPPSRMKCIHSLFGISSTTAAYGCHTLRYSGVGEIAVDHFKRLPNRSNLHELYVFFSHVSFA